MAKDPGLALDPFNNIVNVQWGGACRFAVCGYDGTQSSEPFAEPDFFGVGAYSDDGKSWTPFTVFENGGAVSIFYMKQHMVIVGGGTNQGAGGVRSSTAALTTIGGDGPAAVGGESEGSNAANFGSIGYDKKKKALYAVENSGYGTQTQILHTFQFGEPGPPGEPSTSEEPSIFWAGPHLPEIEPVRDCSCTGAPDLTMTFRGKGGKKQNLSIVEGEEQQEIHLDGEDITPPDARRFTSAAAGLNDGGEVIIIAVGYQGEDEEARGAAWWSINGQEWTEISGIWNETPALQVGGMASAVPKGME